eukprot:3937802-Rhodomonas_salina.2
MSNRPSRIAKKSKYKHEMGNAAASPRQTAPQLHAHIRSHNKLSLRKLRLTELPPAQHTDPSRGDLPADFC